MRPILFSIAGIDLYTFGFSIVIALSLGSLIFYLLAKSESININFITNNLLIIFFFSLIGGRFFSIVFHFSNYFPNIFKMFFIWDGGISMWGTIISAFLIIYYLASKHDQHIAKCLDVLAISFIFCSSIIFLGQFFGGQGFGRTTDFILGVYYENISSPYSGVLVHPTSLYMSISCFVIFILSLFIFILKRPYYSFVYNISLILFCIAHIITENLRWDITYFIFGYNAEKIISITILVILLIYLFISLFKFYGTDLKKKLDVFFSDNSWNRNRPIK